jgi:hypothetical protein
MTIRAPDYAIGVSEKRLAFEALRGATAFFLAAYGGMHHTRRTYGYVSPSGAYGYAGPNSGTIPQSAIDFQEQGFH